MRGVINTQLNCSMQREAVHMGRLRFCHPCIHGPVPNRPAFSISVQSSLPQARSKFRSRFLSLSSLSLSSALASLLCFWYSLNASLSALGALAPMCTYSLPPDAFLELRKYTGSPSHQIDISASMRVNFKNVRQKKRGFAYLVEFQPVLKSDTMPPTRSWRFHPPSNATIFRLRISFWPSPWSGIGPNSSPFRYPLRGISGFVQSVSCTRSL